MTKRIFELDQSDINNMDSIKLVDIIKKSEGRTLMAEVCCGHTPLIDAVSNAEAVAAFGSDMITLNLFDMQNPFILGLYPEKPDNSKSTWLGNRMSGIINQIEKNNINIIQDLKKVAGRLIGVNLEPVVANLAYDQGFCANPDNYQALLDLGFDYVVLTGNPKTGVTIDSIAKATKDLRQICGDKILVIAGKMHGAGGDNVYSLDDFDCMVHAGADVVMVGAPATLPGYTVEFVADQIKHIHQLGVLAKTAIGTSQEGADINTVRDIALWSKMAGADIVHIGDAAYGGMALPENIMAMSIALRGIRHTYRRMSFRK